MFAIIVLIISLTFLLPNFTEKPAPPDLTGIPITPVETAFKSQGLLSFSSPGGKVLTAIELEIVDGDIDRQIGMMYREEMAENQGMLFIFDNEKPRSFWMKNTEIPLDIIFVNTAYEIVTISKYAESLAQVHYTSEEPSRYVVEVNAGFTDKFGISTGDKIVWRRN